MPSGPIQPSVNPGYANRYINDPLIGGGQITTTSLPPASAVAPGTDVYDSGLGPMYSDGSAYRQKGYLALKKHPFMPAGVANVQAVMATPPTVAISTTNPLAAGQQFTPYFNSNSTGGAGSIDLSFCSISRCGNPIIGGTTSPNFDFVRFETVSATPGGASYAGGNTVQVGVMFTGLQIVLLCKGLATNITAKVNDQYVSLTPTAVPANGTLNYYSLTFATAVPRRIDFIADNIFDSFYFGGFFIGLTDTLYPAQVRGPRIMVYGDSVTTGTGSGSTALGFAGVLAEYLGWDDVWQSGIGGTGLIATGGGSYCNYVTRAVTDIYPFAPDEVIIQGFFNDNNSPLAQVQAALVTLIAGINANLPATRVTVFGPYIQTGSGAHGGTAGTTGFNAQRAAAKAAVASFNSPNVNYIDPSSGPAPVIPQQPTLTNSPAANATTFTTDTFLSPGTTYQFPDGSRCFVLSRSGFTATVDRVTNAQTSGTVITQVGNCYLRGTGKVGTTTGVGNADLLVSSDGIHPSPAGHLALGLLLGEAYAAQLNS